jgi:hypothetical protein
MLASDHPKLLAGCLALLLLVVFVPRQLDANHSWGKYHWDGDSLPVYLDVGDNLTNQWAGYLATAVTDWNVAPELELTIVNGLSDSSCAPTFGRIEVCNAAYGDNGWLGLAQVWAKGQHILQATTLVNDTYYSLPFYDTYEWRQMVMCQEIAHDFGLDHQDEDFGNTNLGTCMDYTSDPAAISPFNFQDNTAPNSHDYEEIAIKYAHVGGGGGGGGGGKPGGGGGGGGRGRGQGGGFPAFPDQALQRLPINAAAQWGLLIRANGRFEVYELDLGNDRHVFTFVIWA